MSSISLIASQARRTLSLAVWAVGLSVLAGCPQEPASVVCPGTGIICPENTYCGAVQPICLTTSCGNGIVDLNEQCDDGNILEGDNCSPICKREECGNNVLDPNEVCDDGNKANSDGCSANCMSKEVCGNTIVDIGEACDDGNATNGDGCSGTPQTVGMEMSPAPCKSTEVCGNGIKDLQVGEVCDDGNTVSGDHCNSNCQSGEGCGNGFVDPGEQCDDGNMNNGDDCLNTCRTAKCGDGVVDNTGTLNETCDAGTTGTPVETATCNIDCTTRSCGDRKVNQTAGEQCDDGLGVNGDTKNCTATCLLNRCGDGLVDMTPPVIEQCDDGNSNNTDGCSNACALASCGNSTVDMGEMCDDGNTNQTDACVMCHTAICGDGFTRAGVEQCDDGNTTNGDNCSSTCRIEVCGNMIIDPGELCDDGNSSNTDACTNGCQLAFCGDNFVRSGIEQCDDGNTVNGDLCSSQCRLEGCGNGTLDPGEQCDDSNTNPGDGCSATCRFEACGDGVINNGEACDGTGTPTVPGVGGETANCNSDCTVASCGDSKTNATRGEQCDAGPGLNANDRDCTAMCKINICTDGHVDTKGPIHFEFCDDGNMIPTDGCNNSCTLASCGNGLLDPGEQCDDNNNVNTDSCNNCQNARCGDGVVRIGVEECDGGANCSANCTIQICGNGIIDPGEQCDDDNLVNGDGCSGNGHPLLNACKFEFCGDKLKGASETCDYTDIAVSASGNGACNRDCTTAVCGDAKLSPFAPSNEQCDLGTVNNALNMGCSPACQLDHCGDGNPDGIEQCDQGSGNSINGPCLPWCRSAVCGDGVVESASTAGTENCDLGTALNGATTCPYGVTSCSTCSSTTCTSSTLNSAAATRFCGDGTLDNTGGDPEVCDNGTVGSAMFPANGSNVCPYNTSCTTCKTNCSGAFMPAPVPPTCGDGVLDDPTEVCDFGAGNNTGPKASATPCPYGQTCQVCGAAACTGPACCTAFGTPVVGKRCGDGTIDNTMGNTEQCDDGTANTNDANCTYGQTTCTPCNLACADLTPVVHRCGDSSVEPAFGEACDGAMLNGGTCAGATNMVGSTGTLMCGGGCQFNTSLCHLCGNSTIEFGETCDAGGSNGTPCVPTYNNSCNYCSASCAITLVNGGFCGDGTRQGAETCDDGNTVNGDGCTACQTDAGYTCTTAMPNVCSLICTVNGVCGPGETFANCPADCLCGNGTCGAGETTANCAVDCFCGNGSLDSGEVCDGAMIGGATCMSAGFSPPGTPACASCALTQGTCAP